MLDERIKFAEERRDEALSDGSICDIAYWNGYIDALRAVKKEFNKKGEG